METNFGTDRLNDAPRLGFVFASRVSIAGRFGAKTQSDRWTTGVWLDIPFETAPCAREMPGELRRDDGLKM